ncbi:SCY1 protein kinase [Allomyces macrogynus ATCC 38327]|uniref:SCY1 protein kinase n=1 Tax=Allomyces macrogynus (strain ATCC 38327) TaxID=578462 RepID=A0A0L0SZJ4_ALLM3|nr:SCY1 protein kinase [Allomyces macrogynus ATCC 38327]|eukprot:KNE67759.1 SCY1 protein kinase [Allomyces macrogynus ATCC 38327]
MASLVSNFIKSTVSRVVGPGKDLPNVNVGDKVLGDHGMWTLYNGTMRDSGAPVTVFHFEVSGSRAKEWLPLAQNAYKKMKMIRHPEVLRFVDGNMTDSNIYIVTDRVTMLSLDTDYRLITLGLFKTATALQFMHKDCGMIHGHLSMRSVYVTQAGEWKLGGFELTSSIKETYPLYTTHQHLVVQEHTAPEMKQRGFRLDETRPTAPDIYQFGALMRDVTGGGAGHTSFVAIQAFMHAFLAAEPGQRPADLAEFLHCSVFTGSELVAITHAIENMAVQDERERNHLIERIAQVVDEFPIQFSKHKILPILLSALEYGTVAPKTLLPIFKIASHLSDTEFKQHVNPSLIKLFSMTDRTIRLALLEALPLFVDRLDKRTVNDKIYSHVAIGFADTAPIIREHTIKSMVLLAPKLSERTINNDVLRNLGKAQIDAEAGIRTNATVCLAKIAPHLTPDIRKKVLAVGLARILKDPFPPARQAGLAGFVATYDYFDADELTSKVLPAVAPTLLDTEKPARDLAFQLLDRITASARDVAAGMPETAQPPPPPDANAIGSAAFQSMSVDPNAPPKDDSWLGGITRSLSTTIGLESKPQQPQVAPSPFSGTALSVLGTGAAATGGSVLGGTSSMGNTPISLYGSGSTGTTAPSAPSPAPTNSALGSFAFPSSSPPNSASAVPPPTPPRPNQVPTSNGAGRAMSLGSRSSITSNPAAAQQPLGTSPSLSFPSLNPKPPATTGSATAASPYASNTSLAAAFGGAFASPAAATPGSATASPALVAAAFASPAFGSATTPKPASARPAAAMSSLSGSGSGGFFPPPPPPPGSSSSSNPFAALGKPSGSAPATATSGGWDDLDPWSSFATPAAAKPAAPAAVAPAAAFATAFASMNLGANGVGMGAAKPAATTPASHDGWGDDFDAWGSSK